MAIEIFGEIPKEYWKTGKPLIVKVQSPLYSHSQILIYPEKQEWEIMIDYDECWKRLLFPKSELKTYWTVCFDKTARIEFLKQVEKQSW